MEIIIFLIIGSAIGTAMMYFKIKANYVPKSDMDALGQKLADSVPKAEIEKEYVHKTRFDDLSTQLSNLSSEIKTDYVPKTAYEALKDLHDNAVTSLAGEHGKIEELTGKLATFESAKKHLEEKLSTFNDELGRMRLENERNFREVASGVLTETSANLITKSAEVVAPLKTELESFKHSVESAKTENIRDLTSLKEEIKTLGTLNQQLSEDAQSLTSALKSDVKVQGNLGEDRLKYILEAEGLERYVDFTMQESFKDEETERNRRPDTILNLPEQRCLVIDSKVSLTSYWDYFNTVDPEEKKKQQKLLVKSVKEHIDELSDKNYPALIGLKTTPDFVVMVMPFEASLTMALNVEPSLFERAIAKKVIIVTPMTLVALLKVVKLIWQTENRIKNVEDIFDQCGKLYDKFELFVTEFLNIGESLEDAKSSFVTAKDRLTSGKRKGETILGRFENIRKLEAKTSKSLPANLLKELDLLEDGDEEENVVPAVGALELPQRVGVDETASIS